MKTWQGIAGNSGPTLTTWNYDGARGWLAAKDYSDATSGQDYLYSDAGRMRTNQPAQSVSGSTRPQRVYRYGTGGVTNIFDADLW